MLALKPFKEENYQFRAQKKLLIIGEKEFFTNKLELVLIPNSLAFKSISGMKK